MEPSLRGQTPNLLLATLAFAVCFSAWGMLAPLAPGLQDDLGLSNTETSVMIAIPVILGSLLRIPLGLLTDRIGGRIVFTGMLAYSAGAALLVGFAHSYAALLGAGFLLGTTGASFAVGIPFVAEWYEERRQGFALGVYGIGNIGTAVAAFSVPAIRDAAGQATAGIVFAVVIGAYALIWSVLARDAPGRHSHRIPYMEVLRSGWDLYRLSLFYFVTFGGFVAMAIFLPKLLTDWFDYSLADAGLRAAGFTVFATAARPVGGWLADRVGARAILVAVFAGVGFDAIGLAWQASGPAIVPVTIFSLTMAIFLGLGNGAVFKEVPVYFPRTTGAATGIIGAAGGLGGFFPPLLMGIVKDATGEFVLGFVFLVAFAWLCAGVATGVAGPPAASAEDGPGDGGVARDPQPTSADVG
jgi:MFS transporter, NNP family, nitrate/nitrite transporter